DRNFQAVRDQADAVGRRSRLSRPNVDANMMMVTASREEQCPGVRALRHSQTEEFAVESLGNGQVFDVKVDVPQVGVRELGCRRRLGGNRGKEVLEIEWSGHHRNLPILPAPL